MLKLKRNCAVCQQIQLDQKLLNRIYNSSWFLPHSADSLKQIAATNSFSYDSILNHVKKHQFLNGRDFTEKMTRAAAKQAEAGLVVRAVAPKAIWDGVLSKGEDMLNEGSIKLTTADVLKAAKDKSDYEFKKSDQQLAVMATIAHFASEENKNERIHERRAYIDSSPAAEDSDAWQTQSGDFYQSLAGSPATPRPGQVPLRDDPPQE